MGDQGSDDLQVKMEQARLLITEARFEEAEALLRPLLANGFGPAPVWAMLALAVRGMGRIGETRDIQLRIVDALPGNFVYRFDLAETLLLMGDFERGWKEYHYRYNLPHTFRLERKVQVPRWDGSPLNGRTILIHDEQGYGDTFQFLRMVPWVKDHGGKIVLQVHPDVVPFAKQLKGYDQLIVRGELPPPFQLHAEMMSLPMITKLKLSDLPGQMPYFRPDPVRLRMWKQRLANLPRPLVALVWAGRLTHLNDKNRSLSLDQLAPLAQSGVTFLAVQKGPAVVQALNPPPGMRVEALDSDIDDFEDTAAILSIADLLISCDSSPVHLAGALGRPAWVMLPYVPDWRWLINRDDTPWYPTLRLFRQPTRGDYGSVIAAMAQELTKFHERYRSRTPVMQ